MFRMRVITGDLKGRYYQGYDAENMLPLWTDQITEARRCQSLEAVSITLAALDRNGIILVAERTPETTNANCELYAKALTANLFPGTSNMQEIVSLTIREAADDLIHDTVSIKDSLSKKDTLPAGYWLTCALAANKGG